MPDVPAAVPGTALEPLRGNEITRPAPTRPPRARPPRSRPPRIATDRIATDRIATDRQPDTAGQQRRTRP